MLYESRMTENYIQKIHNEALKVLKVIGISVENDKALKSLANKGIKIIGTRAFFEPEFVNEQLAEMLSGSTAVQKAKSGNKISLTPNAMPLNYLNPYSRNIEPMNLANLIQTAKFVETIKDDGMSSYVAGLPTDIPTQMNSLTEIYVGVKYTENACNADTYFPEEALPYVAEIYSALEKKMCGWFYSISPLRLAGGEFDAIINNLDLFESISCGSLPSIGISGPIYPDVTWALAIAEALGAAMVIRMLCSGKPVSFFPGVFAFDLRSMITTNSSPESLMMAYDSYQIHKRYYPDAQYNSHIYTAAKSPGIQAAMEKGLSGSFAVALGCRNLHGAGGLCEYDIFSPEQAMIDIELKKWLERLITETPIPPMENWSDIIKEGYLDGYMNTDTTLDNHKEIYYYPSMLDRSSLGTFLQNKNNKKVEEIAREKAMEKIEGYSFKPAADKIRKVSEIYNRAWRALAKGTPNPFDAMEDNT